MRLSWGPWAVAILGALVVLGAAAVALTLGLKVPVDPREGWNAYNAATVASGGQLYPGGLWFNNYPPLSYFVVGSLGAILGDAIVAGRIVALVSALSATWLVGLAAWRMHCNRLESLFAGLLFAASPWVLAKYAQMDDPQMLGHALGCAGFAVVVWRPDRMAFIALGAFFLALALFVKPLFVVQPLALLVWLTIYHRTSAAAFLIFGCLLGLAGLLLSDVLLKTDLMHDMMFARVYSLSRMFSHPGQWLVSGAAPLVATACLVRHRGDRYAMLCVLYALIAVPFCFLFSGGEGVAGNATFDLSIACALGTAVFANRIKGTRALDKRLESQVPPPSRSLRSFDTSPAGGGGKEMLPPPFTGEVLSPAQAGRSGGGKGCLKYSGSSIVIACVLPLTATFAIGMFGGWASGPSIVERMELAPTARRDIAFIESRPGPALCEQPALCYWSGKPAQVDVWGLSQALAEHTRPEASLASLLDARRFAVIDVSPRSALFRFATIRASLARNYKRDHADKLGIFLVPAAPNRT